MAIFVAMRGEEIGTIGRAIERDFALGTAADRADGLRLGRTKTLGPSFFANWTGHRLSQIKNSVAAEYAARREKTKFFAPEADRPIYSATSRRGGLFVLLRTTVVRVFVTGISPLSAQAGRWSGSNVPWLPILKRESSFSTKTRP